MRRQVRSLWRCLQLALGLSYSLAWFRCLSVCGYEKRALRRGYQRQLQSLLQRLGVELDLSNLPDELSNGLVVANHISYLDIVVLQACLPAAFVGKSEIRSWPIFGRLAYYMDHLFVDRHCMHSRLACLHEVMRRANHEWLVIFPEGTTTASRQPQEAHWHRGHAVVTRRRGVPIYAASISYQDHETVLWIDDMALLPHLFVLLQRERIKVQLRFSRVKEKVLNKARGSALGAITYSAVLETLTRESEASFWSQDIKWPGGLNLASQRVETRLSASTRAWDERP